MGAVCSDWARRCPRVTLCYTNSARTDPALVPRCWISTSAARLASRRFAASTGGAAARVGLLALQPRGLPALWRRGGDVNGTPKIFSREVYESLGLFSEGDVLDLELLVKAVQLGLRIVELPV